MKQLLIPESSETHFIGCCLFAKPRFVLIRNNSISYSSFFSFFFNNYSTALVVLQPAGTCSLTSLHLHVRSWCGQRLGAELGTEVWFVPVASKAGKETTACVLALCKSLPVQRCPEGERKGLKLVFGAFHESQAGTGGQIQQSPACSALGQGMAQASTVQCCWQRPAQFQLRCSWLPFRSPSGASSVHGILLSSAGNTLPAGSCSSLHPQ